MSQLRSPWDHPDYAAAEEAAWRARRAWTEAEIQDLERQLVIERARVVVVDTRHRLDVARRTELAWRGSWDKLVRLRLAVARAEVAHADALDAAEAARALPSADRSAARLADVHASEARVEAIEHAAYAALLSDGGAS